MSTVENFMAKLAQQQPKTRTENFSQKNRSLEKVFLNFPGNFGRYQVLPMNSMVTDYPFVTLFNTREVQIPRKNLAADGTENVYNAWIRILPKDAYIMKEPGTGRVVSSLTAAEDQLLGQAYMLYDQLFEELDVRNNRDAHITSLIRKRNYTIFHGYCMNKWSQSDSRNPEKQNFSALYVVTAKGFTGTISDSIEERSLSEGGDLEWVSQVYNRDLMDRSGYLLFSVVENPNQAGYLCSASHEPNRAAQLKDIRIPAEDAELMVDPVASFLGWQAARDENPDITQRRLFNAKLIEETIAFLGQQLSAIRMAKSNGLDIATAIANTTSAALANSGVTNTMGQPTNDPILASMSQSTSGFVPTQGSAVNPGAVMGNNTDPFTTPPAAQINPITNAPTEPAPFSAPDFGSNFGGGSPF